MPTNSIPKGKIALYLTPDVSCPSVSAIEVIAGWGWLLAPPNPNATAAIVNLRRLPSAYGSRLSTKEVFDPSPGGNHEALALFAFHDRVSAPTVYSLRFRTGSAFACISDGVRKKES